MRLAPAILFCAGAVSACAGNLDTIGITLLRQVDPALQGAGVRVAQVEAAVSTNLPPPFEVNPSAVGKPASLFTWISSNGTAAAFPNSVGVDSSHADSVAGNFFGASAGAATNVAHVDNYEADYFLNNIIGAFLPPDISDPIVNQSFTEGSDDPATDQQYDTYAADFNTLFMTGAERDGFRIHSPATCYNGIGVDVTGVSNPPLGPTSDGRSKPDITAPDSGVTSFSTPYVSASAAILLQAALRGDGGANANDASDIRVLKSLLLNGAIKPADWTNGPATPLDARYGAGVLNVFNSWKQLKGGEHAFIETTSVGSGGAHPPGANANNEPALSGWDFNSISTARIPTVQDTAAHYYFNLPGSNFFTLTATLAWNRQSGQSAINDLNLYLFNVADSSLVACSTSLVDNVEHLFLPQKLAPGRYYLQVLKRGSFTQISSGEIYALAFEFSDIGLSITRTNGNVFLSWPIYPAGFRLVSAANLSPPVSWTSNFASAVTVDTNSDRNVISVPISGGNQFFRLQRP